MESLKEQWNIDMALEVLKSETVQSELWMEAVQWLLLFGPDELKDIVAQASNNAFHECFPGLKPAGFSADGQPCYSIHDLAAALGIAEEEALEKLQYFEQMYGIAIIGADDVSAIQ